MRGKYNIKLKYPYTPGWEGSGTVVQVGTGFALQALLGKRVAFTKQFETQNYQVGGAFADYAITNLRGVIPLSEDFSFEEAAAFVINPLTAVAMVERCQELGSRACIVTAASSQIARMIIKLL